MSDKVCISRECAEEAIDGFQTEINEIVVIRDFFDQSSDPYKSRDMEVKHNQSRIDELRAALENKA